MELLRRSLLTGGAAAAWTAGSARAAVALPYGDSHVFAAYRNGEKIGTHALSFADEAGKLTVTTDIHLAVRVLGIVVYRYRHRCSEAWSGSDLLSLAARTDDNGSVYNVQRDDLAALGLLPSTHWNPAQVRQQALLNTQTGEVARVSVREEGTEAVATARRTIAATRYAFTGDIRMEQWFDERSRWVKSTFRATDGSRIEYILQE